MRAMMDKGIVGAVEAAYHFGFPLDAGAVLLIVRAPAPRVTLLPAALPRMLTELPATDSPA